MWHKPCRTFHPWCLCIKTRCLYKTISRCLDDQARDASFEHKHGALTSALKLTVVDWLVESETKTSGVTWQHANSTIVGSSVYTVESVDSQGLNCQMLVIAICGGLSLWIYCWMSLVWIWLLIKVCSSQHNVLTVSKGIFHSVSEDRS